MTPTNDTARTSRTRIDDEPLGVLAAAYGRRLKDRGYALGTRCQHLSCLDHFQRWAANTSPTLDVTTCLALVDRFVTEHLPRCHCRGRVQRHSPQVRAALRQLPPVLEALGSGSSSPTLDALERELEDFDAYMRDQRGLSANTRTQRRNIVTGLLRRSLDRRGQLRRIDADLLRSFIGTLLERWSPASAHVMAGALRAYLRYRAQQGDDVAALLPVIASPACWRLAGLPETIASDEVERVLGSFGPPLPSRLRGAAVAQCVARLGLRSAEVVGLELEDFDWRAGTVRLRRSKSRRVDVLPLPATVGAAIAAYLSDERPACASRRVFVRHVAPVEVALQPSLVGRVIRDAYRRCGLPYTRVHIFRHSLAARVLDGGGTLKEVADVLRHRSLDTTQIYAKLDERRLSAVTMPWPGRAS